MFTFTYFQMWKQHIINTFDFLRKIILDEISYLDETNVIKAFSIVLIERFELCKIKCNTSSCLLASIGINPCGWSHSQRDFRFVRNQKKPRGQVWKHRWIHVRFMFEMESVRGIVSKCIIQGGGWLYRRKGCRYVRFDAANSCLVKLLFCAANARA